VKAPGSCSAVEQDPDKVSGALVFQGTRVPVAALFENLPVPLKILGLHGSVWNPWAPWIRIGNPAFRALRIARGAGVVAAVQDQPVVGVLEERLRDLVQEAETHLPLSCGIETIPAFLADINNTNRNFSGFTFR